MSATMTKTLERLSRIYREADPDGGAAEWLEEDAMTHHRLADGLGEGEPEERKRLLQTARESESGARLLRAVLRMRLPAKGRG